MATNRLSQTPQWYKDFYRSRGVGEVLSIRTIGDYLVTVNSRPWDDMADGSYWKDDQYSHECIEHLAHTQGLVVFRARVEVSGPKDSHRLLGPITAHSVHSFVNYSPAFMEMVQDCANAIGDPWLTTAVALWNVERLASFEDNRYDMLCAPSELYPAYRQTYQYKPRFPYANY